MLHPIRLLSVATNAPWKGCMHLLFSVIVFTYVIYYIPISGFVKGLILRFFRWKHGLNPRDLL